MKIAVTARGPNLDDPVDPRFGRAAYFVLVETDGMQVDPVANANTAAGGGAGVQSAQLMAERGVTTVLTGNCGPNAYRTLEAAGIQVMVGIQGTVREAVAQFKAGTLTASGNPNVGSHFGTGGNA